MMPCLSVTERFEILGQSQPNRMEGNTAMLQHAPSPIKPQRLKNLPN